MRHLKAIMGTGLVAGLAWAQGGTPSGSGPATYNRDIAPIIYQNCSSCHRPGEVAPFSLLSYQDVCKKAKTVVKVTQKHFMPPWKADPTVGDFRDARRLTDSQVELFQKWLDDGMKEGNPADLPAMPKFTDGWTLGEPDLVLEAPKEYSLDAEGRDVYRCFVVPTKYAETRYVAAMEVRPGNRTVVHHVIAYLDTTGAARAKEGLDGKPGFSSFGGPGFIPTGSLGGWAPGNYPRLLPEGTGIALPANADIVMQVHYHKSGKAETDRTRIGIYFAKGAVDKRMRTFPINYRQLRIPAGDDNYSVTRTMEIPGAVTLHSVMPHMHLIGKEMTVKAIFPDGTEKPLVHVPDWDFNWQTTYRFSEPIKLPLGSKLTMTARFDNSENNPNNPSHPPKLVTRGEETTDEMCIAFFGYTVDSEHITKGIVATGAPDKL
jgi:mono/diheme cytochrome c family protein